MELEKEQDFQVQKILDKKVFNGKTLYLVKWKNYPIEEATWECNKLLLNVKDKIREFKYSKRETELLPDIKFEDEGFTGGDVRDSFKRKRGRPPKLNFSSYRTVVSNPNLNEYKATQSNQNYSISKRPRGRPRGSKNKKPVIESASEQTFDSEGDSSSGHYEIQDKVFKNIQDLSHESSLKVMKKNTKKQKEVRKTENLSESAEAVLDIVENSSEDFPKNIIAVLDQTENTIKTKSPLLQEKIKPQIPNSLENICSHQVENLTKSPIQNSKYQTSDNQGSLNVPIEIQASAFTQDEFQSLQQLLQKTIKKIQFFQIKLNIFSAPKEYDSKSTQTDLKEIFIDEQHTSNVSSEEISEIPHINKQTLKNKNIQK